MAPEMAVLARLVGALDAHDLASFAGRALAALYRELPVDWIEVVMRADREVAGVLASTSDTVEPVARAAEQALLTTLRAPALVPLPPPRELARFPELGRARGSAALLFLPAEHRGEPIGQLVAALRHSRAFSVEALDAMAAVVSGALAHVGLVRRLADLSRRAHRENRHLREDLQQASVSLRMTGAAPAFRQAIAAASAVAVHATPVLLRGESGTGKELLAIHVHEHSPRARRAFLKLNCGAIPEGLVEGELFGHERGAFTGAVRRHEGIFERAQGGTVLLDEIAELPLASQVKLLRVLQSGEYQRVGGRETLRADVRIIAATHRDLEEMSATGAFRLDLLYRLNVFPIVLPPLRERREDLPLLVAALLPRLAARLGRSAPALDRQALSRLGAYDWPGNVRELENVLERALILSPGPILTIPELPSTPAMKRGGASLAAATRRHIEATLRECAGRIYGDDGAAARLGVPPSTLQSKMLRLGIAPRSRRSSTQG